MLRKLRQVRSALKEHSSVSYAKIASASGYSDINLILIKATPPDDLPLRDKYVHVLLKIFSFSPSSFHSFSVSFTRRFGATRSWRVALKCLLLLHRLIRSVPADSPSRPEILWSCSNGLLSLYPCHFRDNSSSCRSAECTVFIRSYALLIDEALDCVFLEGKKLFYEEQEGEGQEEEGESNHGTEKFEAKMTDIGDMLEMLPQLQSIMDRVMGCVPMEKLTKSSIVRSAMTQIIRDSFVCYTQFRREIAVVLDNLLQMPYKNCIAAFAIYKKASVQTSQLSQFYDWCKAKGFCCFYEYPLVDRIPLIQIQALESLLQGMWELTETPSWSPLSPATPSSPLSSSVESEKPVARRRGDVAFRKHHNNKLGDKEEKPLIDLEDDGKKEDDSWEALLESSISFSHDQTDFGFRGSKNGFNNHNNFVGAYKGQGEDDAGDSWKRQLYQPAVGICQIWRNWWSLVQKAS
ncbi:probable clathrin assembly protein At4g32285 [Neltuma alba]|uniref:probable clathrin assembly protein At4g32285 n=1 Tax=Neltuma alba TaxID=207710 RepID=UPI0010A513E5|nr:probable clathrin assembly protein At4g32285 [Prosopis alba]